jgi:hypothetical protein
MGARRNRFATGGTQADILQEALVELREQLRLAVLVPFPDPALPPRFAAPNNLDLPPATVGLKHQGKPAPAPDPERFTSR